MVELVLCIFLISFLFFFVVEKNVRFLLFERRSHTVGIRSNLGLIRGRAVWLIFSGFAVRFF